MRERAQAVRASVSGPILTDFSELRFQTNLKGTCSAFTAGPHGSDLAMPPWPG